MPDSTTWDDLNERWNNVSHFVLQLRTSVGPVTFKVVPTDPTSFPATHAAVSEKVAQMQKFIADHPEMHDLFGIRSADYTYVPDP